MPLVETALAFIVAMLAASLFVTALVEVLQRIGKYRAQGLSEMLTALIHGFRVYHNDDEHLDEHKAGYDRFVNDVLGDPVFYVRSEQLDITALDGQPRLMEQVSANDLVGIVYNWCRYYAKSQNVIARLEPDTIEAVKRLSERGVDDEKSEPHDLRLPEQWMGADPKPYAVTSNLAAYVERWFERLCLTATERYRTRILRLTAMVAASVVVLFNFDGFELLHNLYGNAGGREALISQASSLEATADRLGVPKGTASTETNKELLKEMSKTASILDRAHVGLGWQEAPIVKEWCAFRGKCGDVPKPKHIALDTFQWAGGLLFSIAMLSLGSPFWYRLLRAMLNAKKGDAPEKPDDKKPTPA